MASVDRPNVQLDNADLVALKAHISDVNDATHFRFLMSSSGLLLDQYDLAAIKASRDGSQTKIDTVNVLWSAADMAVIGPLIT